MMPHRSALIDEKTGESSMPKAFLSVHTSREVLWVEGTLGKTRELQDKAVVLLAVRV